MEDQWGGNGGGEILGGGCGLIGVVRRVREHQHRWHIDVHYVKISRIKCIMGHEDGAFMA